jgi:hypothetical protein
MHLSTAYYNFVRFCRAVLSLCVYLDGLQQLVSQIRNIDDTNVVQIHTAIAD